MGIPTQHDRTSSENRWIDKHINNSTEGQLDLVGIRQATERGYAECVIGGVADFSYPESQTRRGRVQGGGKISPTITATETGICKIERREMEQLLIDGLEKIEGTCAYRFTDEPDRCVCIPGGIENVNPQYEYRIRKLTARECWRLMGFSDEDFDKAEKVNSNTQLYKQAGNSIVVSCLMAIFSQLNIKGVKAWNDMTDDERYQMIGK